MAECRELLLIVKDDLRTVELPCAASADDCGTGGGARSALSLGMPPPCDTPEERLAIVCDLVTACKGCAATVSGQDAKRHGMLAHTLGALECMFKPCGPKQLRKVLAHAFGALEGGTGETGLTRLRQLLRCPPPVLPRFLHANLP